MKLFNYFSKGELILWLGSSAAIIAVGSIFPRGGVLNLAASLIGAASLIFCAKGNPAGQALMIVFSIMYGFISFSFAYYGEMATYLGMTLPMAVFSLIAWLKNPYNGNRAEVKVNRVGRGETALMIVLAAAVTAVFYQILGALHTANLYFSTLSVTTSFVAAYLTLRRCPFFALAYAVNDLVLIILWTAASLTDTAYVSVAVCFAVFFVNDIYGFISWRGMSRRQRAGGAKNTA